MKRKGSPTDGPGVTTASETSGPKEGEVHVWDFRLVAEAKHDVPLLPPANTHRRVGSRHSSGGVCAADRFQGERDNHKLPLASLFSDIFPSTFSYTSRYPAIYRTLIAPSPRIPATPYKDDLRHHRKKDIAPGAHARRPDRPRSRLRSGFDSGCEEPCGCKDGARAGDDGGAGEEEDEV